MATYLTTSDDNGIVAEPHNFYAAPAPGKHFYSAPGSALLNRKAIFSKQTKVNIRNGVIFLLIFMFDCLL
jgi:hypothetical protein